MYSTNPKNITGFGIGKSYSGDQSTLRLKGYYWFLSCITYDFELTYKSHNFSLIPVLPIYRSSTFCPDCMITGSPY